MNSQPPRDLNTLRRDAWPAPAPDPVTAVVTRKSIRAFLPTLVPRSLVRHLLEAAGWAPSGTNTQPWRVYVLDGATRQRLSDAVLEAFWAGRQPEPEYHYYPRQFREPYLSRRREVGYALYATLGIAREDRQARARQMARNYCFFDAPVGLIFTIDRDLERGSWLDYGMYLQSIMMAARGFGLHSCPQQAFAQFHDVVRAVLAVPDAEMVVCGMALGYAREEAPENALETTRRPVGEVAVFVDPPSDGNDC